MPESACILRSRVIISSGRTSFAPDPIAGTLGECAGVYQVTNTIVFFTNLGLAARNVRTKRFISPCRALRLEGFGAVCLSHAALLGIGKTAMTRVPLPLER